MIAAADEPETTVHLRPLLHQSARCSRSRIDALARLNIATKNAHDDDDRNGRSGVESGDKHGKAQKTRTESSGAE